MNQAGEEESRDEDDEDEDGGVVCEVGMGVEGEAFLLLFWTKLLGESAMPQQNGMMIMMVKVMMLSMRGGKEILAGGTDKKERIEKADLT